MSDALPTPSASKALPSPDLPSGFGSLLPEVRSPRVGPATRVLAARLGRVESRNVTFLDPMDLPPFWTEARGANVRDAEGNCFVDLTGAFGVALAGHAHPRVVKAIREQGERLLHGMGDVHPPETKVRLLEALARIAPWPRARSFLANSGSEAVEAALKTAVLATGRSGILAFEGSYHGLTLGALAATHREDFRAPFRSQLHGRVHFLPFPDLTDPDPEGAMAQALDRVEAVLEGGGAGEGGIGAVILEPIQGRAGVRVPPPGFLAGVGERARAHGAVVIHDEIFCGLGRTGRVWASAWEGESARPDLLCTGKALGGGLPMSALVGDARVMDAWPASRGEALHTSTFLGHPLAAATALAFLEILEGDDLPARATEVGAHLRRGLEAALASDPPAGFRGIRGRGAFLGIVLEGEGAPSPPGVRVAAAALDRGYIVLPAGPGGEVVELSPPLCLTPEQIEGAVGAVAEALRGAGALRTGRAREASEVSSPEGRPR